MLKTFFTFLFPLCSLFCVDIQKEKVFFSICAFFKNEARYLKEWIEYHRIQGAERFYLYNNDSQDDFESVLHPYIEAGIVYLKNWPNRVNEKNHLSSQVNAYNDCIIQNKMNHEWIAFIDIDEFILPKKDRSVADYLVKFDKLPHIGSIQINWQVFGTSHIKNADPTKLVIESFLLKAQNNYDTYDKTPHNAVIKSILRPSAIEKANVHYAVLKPSFYYYPSNSNFTNKDKSFFHHLRPIKIDEICINHYWTRDEDYFFNTKLARRSSFSKVPKEKYIEKLIDLNAVEDLEILKFMPELIRRMNSSHIVLN